MRMDKFKESVDQYDKAIQIDPKSIKALCGKGNFIQSFYYQLKH